MSNYTKTTNFGAKDTLPPGDSQKIIRGTEFDTEFNNIATAVATKLEVDGSNNLVLAGTASATKFIPTGGTASGNGLYLPAANTLALSTNGVERVRLDSSGNLLVGTTTGFTSTTSAGAIAAAGIGNYPYISGTGSSGDITASANNIGILHQAPLFTATGGSFTPITSVLVAPRVRNTGSGGTGSAFVVGISSSPLVEGTSANARIGAVGLRAFAVRTSALDVSTQTSNDVYGATGTAGHDAADLTGTPTWPQVYTRNIVGVGGAANVYAGRTGGAGVSANVACSFLSSIFVTASTVSGNTEVNNVARYWGDSFYVGTTSGPTGVVTNAYGLHMPGPIVQATGTVTNYYGVYLTAPTVTGTLANRWAIYSADASSPSYFAGSVQVGAGTDAAPTLTTIADTNTGVFFPAADVIGVSTGGTERARVKSTGQVRFVPLSADPAGAESGDVYYNSTSNKLKVYNGTAWVDLH